MNPATSFRQLLALTCALGVMMACRTTANPALELPAAPSLGTPVEFTVKGPTNLFQSAVAGRLLVVLGRSADPEPRERIGTTGFEAEPVFGGDLREFRGQPTPLPAGAALFPLRTGSEIADGTYYVQAVLMTNRDLRLVNAPGNFYSTPKKMEVHAAHPFRFEIDLDRKLPDETLPLDTEEVRHLKLPSPLLSSFWGRPMFLRVAITLPMGWSTETNRRYPLVIQIGGYGTRFFDAGPVEKRGRGFASAWHSPNGPRFLHVQLDGAGPWGDPYQVNSANNGPYGDALVQELIPYIESHFRGVGTVRTRFVTGGSTGGWVSLALQTFYPDTFGGCWSGYPDSPDFRAYETIDVYGDANAYVNRFGFERPSKRTRFGEVEFTVRHECQLENVLGDGDSYVASGQQWGAWNAVYSARGSDGRPVALWEARSGKISLDAVRSSWEKFDLRRVMESQWPTLGPKLRGKIHLWVGDADDYFLDGGVHHLDEFLKTANPPADARIEFGPGERHGWEPRSWTQLLAEMQAVVDGTGGR
jgi:S-formylglutathione hydrolase FrmB